MEQFFQHWLAWTLFIIGVVNVVRFCYDYALRKKGSIGAWVFVRLALVALCFTFWYRIITVHNN